MRLRQIDLIHYNFFPIMLLLIRSDLVACITDHNQCRVEGIPINADAVVMAISPVHCAEIYECTRGFFGECVPDPTYERMRKCVTMVAP